jgi:hypothetical protein
MKSSSVTPSIKSKKVSSSAAGAKKKSVKIKSGSHVYSKNHKLQTVDKRCLYNRAGIKDKVYTASNVDGKRKYVVYTGKTMRTKQVGGINGNIDNPKLVQGKNNVQ